MSVDVLVPHENHEASFSCVLAVKGKVVPAPERSRKRPFCVLGPYSAREQRACIGCAEGKTERPDSLTGFCLRGAIPILKHGDFNSWAEGRLTAVSQDTAQVTHPLTLDLFQGRGDFAVTLSTEAN